MENFPFVLNNILIAVAAVLFVHDSILLFIRGKNNRARRMMGVTTLIWGLMYFTYLYYSLKGEVTYPIFCGESLISSHVFICIMFLFPLEVLLPGWLSLKRVLIMFSPIALLALIYYLGLQWTGESIEQYYSFETFLQSIGRFNVWYRFVLLSCNLIFLFILMNILRKKEVRYIRWQNENYSDLDAVDISWIRYYRHMMIVIVACYLFVALLGGVWSIIVHTLAVIVCFTIMAYKGLFYDNSYAEDLSSSICLQPEMMDYAEKTALNDAESCAISESSFEAKLPGYVKHLQTWMEAEQPYLHHDFKLLDVARVLPLNRSYLSRVFNEGFQQNFSEVVRMYRIAYAKKILEEQPELTLYKVAEMCGFASDTTFIRAFLKVTGTTPKQFKTQ